MAGFLNRNRASDYMSEIGVDAMILTQPESIVYATGAHPGVAAKSRRATAGMVLVPADPESPLAAIVGDGEIADFSLRTGISDVRGHPVWFDCVTLPASVSHDKSPGTDIIGNGMSTRPAQFDPEIALETLAALLRERNYDKSKVGLELTFVPAIDMQLFSASLPDVNWVDCSSTICRLRAIKAPEEIDILRRAAFLSDRGLYHLREQIAPGHTALDLHRIWRAGVDAQANKDGLLSAERTWWHISVGSAAFAPGGPITENDTIRLDFGVVVSGYSSDIARTWIHGKPSVAQRAIYDTVRETYDACLPMFKHGTPIRSIHSKATDLIRSRDFPSFVRGHFGHGVGASVFSEEWPFISPDEDAILEENMVVAFEVPFYIEGLGSFNVEDQLLITRDGAESMYTYDMSFQSV